MRRGHFLYRVGLCAAVLGVTFMLIPSSGAARYRKRTVTIGPGVTLTRINNPKGPWSIRVVSIDMTKGATLEPVLAQDRLRGFERTSSMASRNGAVAAINGDYARSTGRPVMLFARDGALAQTALTWGVNFAVNDSKTATFIKHQKPELWLRRPNAGDERTLTRFNAGAPTAKALAGFSALAAGVEPPPRDSCSARLYGTESPRAASVRVGVEQPAVVDTVVCRSKRLLPQGGKVVSAPLGTARAAEITSLIPGETVELGWSLGWPDVFDTIGGNPTLVRDGEVFIGKEDTAFFKRHPRTGVGTTPDGRVLLVTVDGRQPGYSRGMTPLRFAKLFVSLGADFALNLDGGGSTTMWANGRIVNRPSDGHERSVSSALMVLPGPDPSPRALPDPRPTTSPPPSPSPEPTTSTSPSPSATATTTPSPEPSGFVTATGTDLSRRELWLRIARDPASTGGLTDWLLHEGIRLRGSLRRAAHLFDAR